MTNDIRNTIMEELYEDFSPEQLREIDLAVAKAMQGYTFTKEETLPAAQSDFYPTEVKEFFARKRIKGCSDKTLQQYAFTLNMFIQWAPKDLTQMTDLDILIFLDYVQTHHKMSNRTLDNVRMILSSFYSFLQDSGKIAKNPMRAIDPIKYTKKVREPLTDMELEKVRAACLDERDRALVEVMYSTGGRLSEIMSLNRSDIDYDNRRALITGKGDKQRFIFFNARSIYALKQYLDTRHDDSDALFTARNAPYNRLTNSGAEYIIKKIGKRAGLDRPLFPHLFRHTMATDMLNNGAPIDEVSKILGHERIETTEIYAKSTTAMLAAEHKRCIA